MEGRGEFANLLKKRKGNRVEEQWEELKSKIREAFEKAL